jgi:hypothetical protein
MLCDHVEHPSRHLIRAIDTRDGKNLPHQVIRYFGVTASVRIVDHEDEIVQPPRSRPYPSGSGGFLQ